MSRVLLITGSSGIAAATAKLATQRGDVVFVVGKEPRECAELPGELKGAVESMTLAAAGYYAPHRIRMNVVAPSLVRAPMSAGDQSNPAIVEFMKQKQPLKGDLIEADEVARTAYFLLSDDSVSYNRRGCAR